MPSRPAMRRVRRSLATLFPATCPGCDSPLPWVAWAGACASCWGRFRRAPETLPAIDGCDDVHALWTYDSHARQFLLRAKLASDRRLMDALALQLAAALPRLADPRPIDGVVPVPSHPWATLRRAFVPARVLATPLAARLEAPLHPCLRRRVRSPIALKRASRSEREQAARRMLRPIRGTVPGRALLVDDVTTTGASLSAAARTLRGAGATRIVAAVWAVAL